MVRRVLTTAQLGLTGAPRALAIRMGFKVMPYCPEHGETHPGDDLIAYAWHADVRERGWRVYQELARVLLRRARLVHNPSDILLTACDLAVPEELVVTRLDRLVREQKHCPETILRRILVARGAHKSNC